MTMTKKERRRRRSVLRYHAPVSLADMLGLIKQMVDCPSAQALPADDPDLVVMTALRDRLREELELEWSMNVSN